jgi:hypothetical protein
MSFKLPSLCSTLILQKSKYLEVLPSTSFFVTTVLSESCHKMNAFRSSRQVVIVIDYFRLKLMEMSLVRLG